MAGSATLNVQVLVDAAKAASGLNDAAQKFENFGKKVADTLLAAVAIKGVTELGKTVVNAASDMQQAMGGTDKVFGSSASAIHTWAADTSDSIRLPAVAAEQFATLIKTQLNATGQPIETLVGQTKALVQVGADLAAVTGVDLADSVAAVKSALAGEYDPIQNLGVAMSGASVQAKALAIAHGDAALAASDAVVMQARVAEIMDKSAFATGAAAEEADSYQGRMDSLHEKLQNLAATAGGPLLDALSNIIGSMSDAASSASTLATGLGTMLGSVLALPAPIQAIVLGLAGFVAVSAKWGTAVSAGFTSMLTSVRNATTSVGGLKAALAGIGPALGGGAIIVGAAVLIGLFAQAIGRVTEGAKKGEDALGAYRDAIVAAGGASTDATAAAFKQAVTTSDAFSALVRDGLSGADAVRILTGTQEDWIKTQQDLAGSSVALSKDTSTLTDGFIDANGHAKTLAQAQIDGAKAMGDNSDATKTNTDDVDANAKALADAEAQAKKMGEALGALKTQYETAFKSDAASQLIGDLDRAEQKAQRSGDVIHAALEKAFPERGDLRANGISDLVDDVSDLGTKLKDADIGGQVKNIVLDLQNMDPIKLSFLGEPGKQVRDWASDFQSDWDGALNQIFQQSGGNVDETVRVMLGHTQSMVQGVADQLGIPFEQAQGIVDKVIGHIDGQTLKDKVLNITAEDQAAFEKTLFYQSITFDPVAVQFVSDIKIPEVQTIVSDLNSKYGLAGAAAQPITAKVDADPAPANATIADMLQQQHETTPVDVGANTTPATGAISDVTGQQYATQPVTITLNIAQASQGVSAFLTAVGTYKTLPVTLTVDQSAATAQINAFIAQQRKTIVTIDGDAAPLNADLIAMISPHRQIVVTIDGDAGPLNADLIAMISPYRQITVHVVADTSAFYSAYNALPTSKTVTINQQVVTTPVPPPAPGLRTTAFAAPSLSRSAVAASPMMTTSGAVGSGSINITVNGAVDPDATARQIQRILTGRGRRAGGIAL